MALHIFQNVALDNYNITGSLLCSTHFFVAFLPCDKQTMATLLRKGLNSILPAQKISCSKQISLKFPLSSTPRLSRSLQQLLDLIQFNRKKQTGYTATV